MPAVIDFVPRRLLAARESVQERHPGTAARPAAPDESSLESLRQRILSAPESGLTLERLADSLSPREVRAAVGGLERWADLRAECAVIVRTRANGRLVPILWTAWQRHPRLDLLQNVVMELGEDFGWELAVGEAYSDAAAEWVSAPGRGLQQWLDDQGLSASDLPNLAGRPVRPDSPLARLAREFVMTHGSLRQLRDDAEHLLDWQTELDPEQAILFGRHYLLTLPSKEWTEPLVDVLHGRYGTPKKPKIERFWEPLPDEVKKAFQGRYIRKRIAEEFEGDDDRERFWQRWAGEIAEVSRGWAGSVRYAEIEFSSFVVFEFFEVGNAAYFYTPGDARAVKRGRVRAPKDLKQIKPYPFLRSDNRLIHMRDWWPKADRMIKLWLRKAQGAS